MKQHDDLPRRRPPGRPRKNVDGAGDGNPILGIRVSTEMKAAIQARGGSEWARQVLERELAKEDKTDRSQHHPPK
jgi:hypothetical protein